MNQMTQVNQIKDECQRRDLVKSKEFYNEKFNELERDNKKKEEKSMNWKKRQEIQKKIIDDLNRVIERHEQYSRRNEFSFRNFQTQDGKIFIKSNDNIIKVYYD